jgi:hypothetical protein
LGGASNIRLGSCFKVLNAEENESFSRFSYSSTAKVYQKHRLFVVVMLPLNFEKQEKTAWGFPCRAAEDENNAPFFRNG